MNDLTRRGFLKTAVGIGATAALGVMPDAVRGAEDVGMKSKTVRNWMGGHGSISKRDRNLLKRAKIVLEGNILKQEPGKPELPWSPYRCMCPSPTQYRGIWNWDAAFHTIAVARWDGDLAREQVQLFFDYQLPTGGFPDVVFEDGQVNRTCGKPPVFPWATVMIDKRSPDDLFLRQAYRKYEMFEKHWRENRGGDADGLFHYDGIGPNERDRHIQATWESGWDNSPRWDSGSWQLWCIDLNCYMVMVYRSLAYMADRLSVEGGAAKWNARAEKLSKLINEKLWDEKTGAYVDYNWVEKKLNPVLTPASFMPLYVGIADKTRAAKMADLAKDPNKFFPGFPSVAYDDPTYKSSAYWRGPMWLNITYFALKGLKRYGYIETAESCRENILKWCDQNGDSIYEYYDSRDGKGLGAKTYGWSAAFVIEFILGWNDDSDLLLNV